MGSWDNIIGIIYGHNMVQNGKKGTKTNQIADFGVNTQSHLFLLCEPSNGFFASRVGGTLPTPRYQNLIKFGETMPF